MLICKIPDDIPPLVSPPIGAIGTIVLGLDEYGEYDVLFDDYPCQVFLPDTSWIVHKSWIVPIDLGLKDAEAIKTRTTLLV